MATPLRSAVEAEPSALFKAQERMNDLVYKNTKRVIGAGDVLLKVDMRTDSLCSSDLSPQDACTEGFKAHSTCTQYFQCVRSKWTTQTCPNNLHWDAANNICNWPDAAGCQEVRTSLLFLPCSVFEPSIFMIVLFPGCCTRCGGSRGGGSGKWCMD